MAKFFRASSAWPEQSAAQTPIAQIVSRQVTPRRGLGQACRPLFALVGVASLLGACVGMHGSMVDGSATSSSGQPAISQNNGVVSDLKSFPPPGVALKGTRWRLVSMAGQAGRLAALKEPPSLLLQEGTLAVTGFAGCNRYFGSYHLQETQLSFGNMGVTKRLCEPAANQVERAFLTALGATKRLVQDGRELSFLDAAGKTLMHLEADPSETRLLPAKSDAGQGS